MTSTDQLSPLQKTLRNAARWSLYLALVLVLITGATVYRFMRDQFRIIVSPWYSVDFMEYRSVRDLQDLVRIDTTHETGREIDAALWLKEQLESYRIKAEIEDMGGGKANIWAKIDGTTDEFIVLHSHLDTDPVGDLDLWGFDPWSAHIEVVWLYARGSFDMKSTIIAQLHTMQALQESIESTGRRPRRGLLMLSTSSEETGSHEGTQHIVSERPELLEGAWALFSEGGVVEAASNERVKYLGVSFGQKRFVDVWYRCDSKEPLEALASQIQTQAQPSRLRVTPSVRKFLAHYANTRQMLSTYTAFTDPDALVEDQGAFEELPDFFKSFFRDEVHALPPEPDPTTNGFRLRVVVHLLEDASVGVALADYLPNEADLPSGVTATVDSSVGSRVSSPLDHPAYLALIATLKEELPSSGIGPYYLSLFANDAQFFRKHDIASYGFQPFLGIAADSYTVGRYNERIALPTFIEGVERYRRIMVLLSDLAND